MTFYNKTKLDNGAIVVTEHVPDVRSVTIGFWVGVGSRDEVGPENGMSHFIEHLLFKGTESRTAKDISETFDSLGAELNAFTTKEFTCFYTRLLDDHLPIGIEVLGDMLMKSLFKSDHIDFERQVVLEEIAMYNDTPDELIHDLFTAALWDKHPLGKQVLGTTATVGAFDRDRVVDFFKRQYVPANMVIAAAGNLEHRNVVELIEKYYNPPSVAKPDHIEERATVQKKVNVYNRKTEQVHICYGAEALDSRHPDRFALSVLENILGGSMSSRLFQRIREERGLAYSVYSYHSLYKDSGNMTFYVGTRPANVNEVLVLIDKELDDIKTNGVADDELSRAKEHLKGQMVLGLESTRNRMTRLGRSEMTHGEILTIDDLVARVDVVTAAHVKDLAIRLFDKERMVLTVIGPIEEKDLAYGT